MKKLLAIIVLGFLLSGNAYAELKIDKDGIDKCDLILQSFVTSPLLKIETIDQCIKKFLKSKRYDAFFTVESTQEYWWSKEGKPTNFDINTLPNGVDLDKIYKVKKDDK